MTIETDGEFYLGRAFDLEAEETTGDPVHYDPDDLTTHAVVVGMTGSGKTGLCIDLMEEAALNGIPALMVDPKGEATNTLLHFPDLAPEDFEPWVNPDHARREEKPVAQVAEEAAERWREGLARWDISPDRIRRLADSADFTVYTPGSDAGRPVSILASLQAPDAPWEANREAHLEKISGTVTALLGLVGLTGIDPVQSREHILLANLFERAWREGQDLELGELILQIQNPPFERLGVFDVAAFFPEKDRFELAMRLNNLLAAPGFRFWIDGEPLEIESMLYGPGGRPRHSVFYLAHLNDAERMFFVTLLLSAVEAWMRTRRGTPSLQALLYVDEMLGYLPPSAVPPSKRPMLRMLKQGRAYGLGLVLATQNPVDLDYKALANAGTWFIGKLQTEQDKARLLDGLQGVGEGWDRATYDRLISSLEQRVFLLHNVHAEGPRLFRTRWAMNYLAGPLTRAQIPALNALAGRAEAAPAGTAPEGGADVRAVVTSRAAGDDPELPGSTTRPAVPGGVAEYFLPNNLTLSQAAQRAERKLGPEVRSLGILYRPALLAQAEIRFFQRKYNLDYEMRRAALVPEPDERGGVRWEGYAMDVVDAAELDDGPAPEARFAALDPPLTDPRAVKALEREFQDWAYRESGVVVRANEALDLYAGPEVSAAEFRQRSAEAAREARDEEIDQVERDFEKRIDRVRKRLAKEQRELSEDETELSQRKMEEMGTHLENVASLLGLARKRRLSTSLSKRRMTQQARADVEESLEAIEELEKEIEALEVDLREALAEVGDRWGETANEITEIPVAPYKKDVRVTHFGVAWVPYHLVDEGGAPAELPGFGQE